MNRTHTVHHLTDTTVAVHIPVPSASAGGHRNFSRRRMGHEKKANNRRSCCVMKQMLLANDNQSSSASWHSWLTWTPCRSFLIISK